MSRRKSIFKILFESRLRRDEFVLITRDRLIFSVKFLQALISLFTFFIKEESKSLRGLSGENQ